MELLHTYPGGVKPSIVCAILLVRIVARPRALGVGDDSSNASAHACAEDVRLGDRGRVERIRCRGDRRPSAVIVHWQAPSETNGCTASTSEPQM